MAGECRKLIYFPVKICRYRSAPLALLLAAAPNSPKSNVNWPSKWNRKRVMQFVKTVAPGYEDLFNMTGSQLFALDPNGVMRRCGGRWSCAAFSEKMSEDAKQRSFEEQKRDRAEAEAAEAAGRCIYEAFYQRMQAAKKLARKITCK